MIQLEKNKNLDHPKAKVHLQMQGKPNTKNSRSEVFLKVLQNSQENTSAGVSLLIKLHAYGQQCY